MQKLLRELLCIPILSIVALSGAVGVRAQAPKTGLSLTQVEQLIKAHNPDGVIANAIQSKGASFKVTPRTLEILTAAGAGPETIAQLRARIEFATIALGEGTSAAVVSIDGQVKSQYSPGYPASVEVETGKHHIHVSLENYQPFDLDVTLVNKQVFTLNTTLPWAGGFINVDVNPQKDFIWIHPLDPKNSWLEVKPSQRVNASGAQLVPGDYDVIVSAPGYIKFKRKVTVHAGERVPIRLQLQKDDTYFKTRIEAMRSRLDEQSAAATLEMCNGLAVDDPGDPDLIDLQLRAALLSGNAQQFQGIALEALRNGIAVPIPMQHIHLGFKDTKHPARLSLTVHGISYDPLGNACSQPAFTEPWSSLQNMQFGKTAAGMPILSLHMKLAAKSGKTVTLSFTGGDLPFNSSGPQNDATAAMLQSVQELLRLQKERVENGQ